MAEEIDNGKIVIDEPFVPVAVNSANIIQVPHLSETHRVIVFVSKHGEPEQTWLKFTDNSLISIKPPFFVMSNRKIELPAMDA